MVAAGDVLTIQEDGHQAFLTPGGDSSVIADSVTLLAADILTLFSEPYELVAGQVGKVPELVRASMVYNEGMSSYEGATGDIQVGIYNADAGPYLMWAVANTLIESGTDTFVIGPVQAAGVAYTSDQTGHGLSVWLASGEASGGDGTLRIDFAYRWLSL